MPDGQLMLQPPQAPDAGAVHPAKPASLWANSGRGASRVRWAPSGNGAAARLAADLWAMAAHAQTSRQAVTTMIVLNIGSSPGASPTGRGRRGRDLKRNSILRGVESRNAVPAAAPYWPRAVFWIQPITLSTHWVMSDALQTPTIEALWQYRPLREPHSSSNTTPVTSSALAGSLKRK